MTVRALRKAIFSVAALLVISSLTGTVAAQALPISVNFGTALPMPIGQTNTVAVTVTDIVNSTVQLTFVGLQFEWDPPTRFFIGGNSDKGAVLTPGQQIVYSIAVTVPPNVTQGVHKLSAYVTYRVLSSNATGVLAAWWVTNIQFASSPQTQGQSQTATTGQPQQGLSVETIGALVLVVGIGLYLERGRVKRLIQKYHKTNPKVTKPKSEKPPSEEKEEQDL